MTSGSTACTDSSTGFARTRRWFHRRSRQLHGCPLLAGMPPIPCASQCCKASPISRAHPRRLTAFIGRITPPLRSIVITTTSSLLRTIPPLCAALILSPYGVTAFGFSLNISTTASRVPHKSLINVHAFFTPVAIESVSSFLLDFSQ